MYCNLTGFQSSHYHSGPTRKFACSLYEILPDNCTNPCGLIIRTVPAMFLNLHELRFSNSHLYTFSRLQILQTCSCRCRLAGTVPVAPLSVWWRWSRVRYELSRAVGLLRPFFGITARLRAHPLPIATLPCQIGLGEQPTVGFSNPSKAQRVFELLAVTRY